MESPWQEVVAAKLAIRDAIPQTHSRDRSVEAPISAAMDGIEELTQQLESGRLSAQYVVRACISQ